MSNHDLTFVAPHRREEVRRRIDVLERFIAAPGRAAAERAATELGLRATQFYRLARIWRRDPRPESLAGAGRPRPRRSLATAEQARIVERADVAAPNDPIDVIARMALADGERRGVAMPALNSLRKMVEMRRTGRLAPSSPSFGAGVVVSACAVDIPVTGDGVATMPVAVLVIDTATPPSVVGLALSPVSADAATVAHALLDALGDDDVSGHEEVARGRAGGQDAVGASPEIAIQESDEPGWLDLSRELSAAGLRLRPTPATPNSVLNDAVALLGRKPGGIRLVPGLTARPPHARRPTVPAGGGVLKLADAEELMRSRLGADRRVVPAFDLLPEVGRKLRDALRDIAAQG